MSDETTDLPIYITATGSSEHDKDSHEENTLICDTLDAEGIGYAELRFCEDDDGYFWTTEVSVDDADYAVRILNEAGLTAATEREEV